MLCCLRSRGLLDLMGCEGKGHTLEGHVWAPARSRKRLEVCRSRSAHPEHKVYRGIRGCAGFRLLKWLGRQLLEKSEECLIRLSTGQREPETVSSLSEKLACWI